MLSSDNFVIRNLVSNSIPILKTSFEGSIDYWMVTKFIPCGELGSDDSFHTIEGWNVTEKIDNILLGGDIMQRVYDHINSSPLMKIKLHKDCKYIYFTNSSQNKINPLQDVVRSNK